MDGVVGGYRKLTGKASMLPRWAFGYLQSQERYETQEEICQVAAEYRQTWNWIRLALYLIGVPGKMACGTKKL